MAPPSDSESAYDVFISHCKKADGTEDRALWCVDVFEEAGMRPFFDLQHLEEISSEQLVHMGSLIQWGVFVPAISEPITHGCEGSIVGAIPIEEGMTQKTARFKLLIMRNGAPPDVGPW